MRALGNRAQNKIWLQWGGPPSTRFMRHRDSFFGENLKVLIHKYVVAEIAVPFLSADEEARNPELADKQIQDVFKRVREYLRAKDASGLWQTHNIEYGFYRNLLGCRLLWSIVALGAVIFAVLVPLKIGGNPFNPASVLNALALVCSIYVGWVVLPDATRRAAEQYAESAWMAFLRIAEDAQRNAAVSPEIPVKAITVSVGDRHGL